MKHILFALSLMVVLVYCDTKPKTSAKIRKGDTAQVRVLWAQNIAEVNAKLLLRDTTIEVWEFTDKDSTEAVKKRKKIVDSIYWCRFADSVAVDSTGKRRWIDTFLLVDRGYIMRVTERNWKTDSVVKREREERRKMAARR
jgi:hypothetical protein